MSENSTTTAFPTFVRETGFEYWNRYAAVNDEFVPIHMEDSAGQAAGYPAAFGMGNLTWAYIHLALHAWFGDTARIESVQTQFRNAVVRGSVVNVDGEAESSEPTEGGIRHVVRVTVTNQDGVVIAPGSATVVVLD
jgi:acyl dehydratase